MASESHPVVTGLLIDEETTLTLDELARACSVRTEWVVTLVEEGVLEPASVRAERWEFRGPALARARTAVRLQRDLDLDTAGLALVLDLLEEIETLRARLRALGDLP